MIRLARSRDAWGRSEFEEVLKTEIAALDAGLLPLQQELYHGSYSNGEDLSVMIIAVADQPQAICVNVGIFYTSVIAGCSCADDPTPVDNLPEFCELRFDIDKSTAETAVTLLL